MSIEELKHEKYHDYQDYVIAKRDSKKQDTPQNRIPKSTNIIVKPKLILTRIILFSAAIGCIVYWITIGKSTFIQEIIILSLLFMTIKNSKKLTAGDIITIVGCTIMLAMTWATIVLSILSKSIG